jgi:hypothetical protein
MKKIIILLFTAIAVFSFSCKDSDENDPIVPEGLSSVYNEAILHYELGSNYYGNVKGDVSIIKTPGFDDTSRVYFNSKGEVDKIESLFYTVEYEYDSYGRLSRINDYMPLSFSYDGYGRISQLSYLMDYDGTFEAHEKTVYDYSNAVNSIIVAKTYYNNGGTWEPFPFMQYSMMVGINNFPSSVMISYLDSAGVPTDTAYDTFDYNSQADVIGKRYEASYHSDSSNYLYDYDANNNWIRKEETYSGIVSERIITYK